MCKISAHWGPNVHISNAHIPYVHIPNVHISNSHISNVHISKAHIPNVHMPNVHISNAHISNVHISKVAKGGHRRRVSYEAQRLSSSQHWMWGVALVAIGACVNHCNT